MTDFMIRVPDYLKKRFEARVGKGKMSIAMRNYMEAVVGGGETIDEQLLRKEVEMLEKQKKEIDAEYFDKKSQLDAIIKSRKIADIEALKHLKEQEEKFADIKMNTAIKHLGSMIR